MATLIEYRLRIRNAADSADAITITSVRGGTNPYLESPPQGDGATFNPLTAESLLGAYTGTIVDSPIGSMQRVVTSQLEDANLRQQLGYRKAFIECQINGGGFTGNVLIAGRLTLLRLISASTWSYTVSDPMQAQTVTRLFGPASSLAIKNGSTGFLDLWPNRGCILGGPVMTPNVGTILGIQDLGGWQMKVHASTISGEYILRPVHVYGPPHWNPDGKLEDVADVINSALVPLQSNMTNGAQSPWTSIKDTQTNYWAWNGVTVLIDKGSGFEPWKPISYDETRSVDASGNNNLTLLLVSTRKGDTGIKVKSDGTRTLTDNSLVRVRVLTVLPTEACPIYIVGHPIDILTTAWTAGSIAYNAAACASVKTDSRIGSDASMALRITDSAALSDIVAAVCRPWGLGIRANGSAELVPFIGREVPNTPPVATITSANVSQDGTSLPFELDATQAVQTVRFRQKRFYDQKSAPAATKDDIVDGVGVANDEITLINGDTTAVPYGQFDIETEGMLHTASAQYPVIEAKATAIARTIFDRFGHGPIAMETMLIRGTDVGGGLTTDDLLLGDEVLVQLPQIPNHNYRLGDNPAVAARAMQIVRRTIVPSGYRVRLLDSGPNAQPLPTVPVVTIAATADVPRTVAQVTITNAATLNGLGYGARLQWATNRTGAVPSASQYTDVTAWPVGLIPSTYRLPPVTAGTTVYVRARSEGVLTSRPSNYGTAAGLTLSSINNPTSVTATPSVTDASLCVLAWTPGSGTSADVTDIWLRKSGEAFTKAVRVITLNPGSNRYTLEGLTAGVAYIASVQHRDPSTHDVSDPIDVSFTAGSTARTLAAPVYPAGFAGALDENGVPQRDGVYGMACVAAERPGFVEVSVAIETAVGSGSYGSFSVLGTVPSVNASWTIAQAVAPNDGLRRQLKARHVGEGATSSAYTSVVTVLPWTPQGLPGYPTELVTQITMLAPSPSSDAGINVRFQVTGIDPLGGTPQVEIVALSPGMSVVSGAAVGTPDVNNSVWRVSQPQPAAGPGTITARSLVGDRFADETVFVPEQTTLAQPQGTIAVDADGNWEATTDGPANTVSFKYITSTSAFPSDASVASGGSILTGARTFTLTGGPLSFGQTIYITIIPYNAGSGTGTALPSIHLRGAYLTYTASKTLNFSRAQFGLTYKFGADPHEPIYDTDSSPTNPAMTVVAAQIPISYLTMMVALPSGVTLVSAAFNGVWNTTAGTHMGAYACAVYTSTTLINSASFTYGAGAQIKVPSLSGAVAGPLMMFTSWTGPLSGTADAGQIIVQDCSITYTMSDPKKTV